MSFKWDRLSTLLFINKFRKIDALWNPRNPHYLSKKKRKVALKKLANSFGQGLDVIEAERKLKTLLNQFYKENRKCKEASKLDENAEKPKPWYAYEAMDFLRKKNLPTPENEVNVEQESTDEEEDSVETAKRAKKSGPIDRDELTVFGEFLAEKIRGMDPVTTSAVEHMIHNIIYQAEMGVYSQLTLNTIPLANITATLRRPSCQSNSTLINALNTDFEETTVKIT